MDLDPLFPQAGRASLPGQKQRLTRRSLPIALLLAREATMARFRPMLARHDITEQQWRVIRMLDEYGEMDASLLARRALVRAPSLTRIVRVLEKRKLLRKRADKLDSRRVLLSLGPAAGPLMAEVTPESLAIYKEIESSFGQRDMTLLLDLLERLIARG